MGPIIDIVFDGIQRGLDRLHDFGEFIFEYHGFGFGNIGTVFEIAGIKAEIQRDCPGAGLDNAEIGYQPGNGVPHPVDDFIVLLNALCQQVVGDPVGVIIKFFPGDSLRGSSCWVSAL